MIKSESEIWDMVVEFFEMQENTTKNYPEMKMQFAYFKGAINALRWVLNQKDIASPLEWSEDEIQTLIERGNNKKSG